MATRNGDPMIFARDACVAHKSLVMLGVGHRQQLVELDKQIAGLLARRDALQETATCHQIKLDKLADEQYERLYSIAKISLNQLEVLEALKLLWSEFEGQSAEDMAPTVAAIATALSYPGGTPVVLRGHVLANPSGWFGERLSRQGRFLWAGEPHDKSWRLRFELMATAGQTPASFMFTLDSLTNAPGVMQKRGVYMGESAITALITELAGTKEVGAHSLPFIRAAVVGAGLAESLCDPLG
ncbi:MAG TPA: hypothetical protein VM581_03735 [Magnetospirillaceae bacterium]|nr:hypothetical protein [Magnetospirillaceae bacterium]